MLPVRSGAFASGGQLAQQNRPWTEKKTGSSFGDAKDRTINPIFLTIKNRRVSVKETRLLMIRKKDIIP